MKRFKLHTVQYALYYIRTVQYALYYIRTVQYAMCYLLCYSPLEMNHLWDNTNERLF
jgi:hypothetical protein